MIIKVLSSPGFQGENENENERDFEMKETLK